MACDHKTCATAQKKPRVAIFATGGTIVSSGDDPTQMTGYRIKNFNVNMLIGSVPALAEVADLEAEQIANIDSSSMTAAVWMKLACAIEKTLARDDISGVVVTHGTDTMEETAWFLDLILKSRKPVVFTGAMRPSTAISADGPVNLFNAVRIAASEEACGKGVMITLNDVILSAREASKVNPTNAAAFAGTASGALGFVAGDGIYFLQLPAKSHTIETEFSLADLEAYQAAERGALLPRVDIVLSHTDADDVFVKAALAAGAKAIVHAGTGNGSVHEGTEGALFAAAKAGVLVVRASRIGAGVVTDGLAEWQEAGFVPAGSLTPQKARILAQLVIVKYGPNVEKLREAFLRY